MSVLVMEFSMVCLEKDTTKTPTAVTLGVLSSRKNQRVYLLEMNPQASLSRTFLRTDVAERVL